MMTSRIPRPRTGDESRNTWVLVPAAVVAAAVVGTGFVGFSGTASASAYAPASASTPASASATSRNGKCEAGEFCYYHGKGRTGSLSDFKGSQDDYGATQPTCYEFKSSGKGKGTCVKNHAASVWNRSGRKVRVYFNSNYAGHHQDFKPGAKGDLDATLRNENASHEFLTSGPKGCTTDGTNTKLPSTILVYRKGSGRVDRVAFKTYVKNVLPNEWIRSWPKESLNAGAMAVKSYAWFWALHSMRKTPSGKCYDVRDDTGDQVYRPGSAATSTSAAVDRTWSTRMTRSDKILRAQYCAGSGRVACSAWVDGNWMSQKGSRDEAARGWGYKKILTHWYRDIEIRS